MRTYYDIQFARFFNFPVVNTKRDSRSPRKRKRTMVFYSDEEEYDNPNVNRLRVISKFDKRLKRGGVWLSSSSTASLHLNFHSSEQPHLVLVISIDHKICEEHYVSKLQFSWPQMACVSECPRGSRVVFASYKDRVGQIQKFAIRFTSTAESQTFISSLKESLGENRNTGTPSTCPTSGNVCQREFIGRNQVHHRGEVEMVGRYPAAIYRPLVESSLNGRLLYPCSERTIHHRENEAMSVPPGFTETAADKHIRTQQEPPMVHEAVCLNTGISKGMTASSFNDMLMKLETIIKGLGGDLSL